MRYDDVGATAMGWMMITDSKNPFHVLFVIFKEDSQIEQTSNLALFKKIVLLIWITIFNSTDYSF